MWHSVYVEKTLMFSNMIIFIWLSLNIGLHDDIFSLNFVWFKCICDPLTFKKMQFWLPNKKITILPLNFKIRCKAAGKTPRVSKQRAKITTSWKDKGSKNFFLKDRGPKEHISLKIEDKIFIFLKGQNRITLVLPNIGICV